MNHRSTLLAVMMLLLSFAASPLVAQFPVTLTLDARSGDVLQSPPTRTDARYRITVSGTYSQWPQFADCHGVDAVWVYDVPQEEIDAFRWPPSSLLGSPFVTIPHWVGDSTTYSFPPAAMGMQPLFELSFRKYLGFRINGEPLAASRLDRTLHRYQHERAGTGAPFTVQILDSTYNVVQGRVIPRYEDNCGELTVTIEEIVDRDINICDVAPVIVDGETIGIRVDAAVFQRDTTAVDGRKNILVSQDQLGIVDNGRFICPDSLVCDSGRTSPLSIGLIVDVSGSMGEPVEYDGHTMSRLEAVKRTLHTFMRTLHAGDSLFLLTFSTTIVLSQDWTADTAQLGRVIDELQPLENTSLHAALIEGLEKIATHQRDGRVLIALSDGLNNQDPKSADPVLAAIRSSNVPLYLVALGFAQSQQEQAGLAAMRGFVAAAPRGRLYEVHTGDELNAVYTEMAESMQTEECCRLYFPLKPCDLGQSKRPIRLVYVDGGQIISKTIVVDCDLKTTSVMPGTWEESTDIIPSARPTPATNVAMVSVALATPSVVTATVYSAEGRLITERQLGMHDIGVVDIIFDTINWTPGIYFCRTWNGRRFITTSIIVQH